MSNVATRIHLIRHGETSWNAERRIQGQAEAPLNNNGKAQASRLGETLAAQHFDSVFSSDLRRTRETVQILTQDKSASISYLEELREIFLGPWEGLLYAEVQESHPDQHDYFIGAPHRFDLEGAETFYELQQRGVKAIVNIANQCTGQEVMIVSHGAIIKAILAFYEDRPLSQLWEPPVMFNCAHSIIEFNEPAKATEPGTTQQETADQNTTARILRYAGQDDW